MVRIRTAYLGIKSSGAASVMRLNKIRDGLHSAQIFGPSNRESGVGWHGIHGIAVWIGYKNLSCICIEGYWMIDSHRKMESRKLMLVY